MINSSKREAQSEVNCMGGDVATILTCLKELRTEDPNWQFEIQLDHTQRVPPEVLFSDCHQSIIWASEITLPLSNHLYCPHHLNGNIATSLRPGLGTLWADFTVAFWTAYRAPSPEEFETGWQSLISQYPGTKGYLSKLYSSGMRTNGHVEVENRVVKAITGPKSMLYQAFLALNDRCDKQTAQEMLDVQQPQSSRCQHDHQIGGVFRAPLELIQEHAGPFALHHIFREMQSTIQLPPGMKKWTDSAVLLNTQSTPFTWMASKEQRDLQPPHIFRITHLSSGTSHFLATLPGNCYICDCCMGVNLGIPCQHFLQAWTVVCSLTFHLGLIGPRWYKNPETSIEALPVSIFDHAGPWLDSAAGSMVPTSGCLLSNPLDRVPQMAAHTPAPCTQTVGACKVNHQANAALQLILEGVRTEEELEGAVEHLCAIQHSREAAALEGQIHNPAPLNPKGRPRTAQITRVLEGRPRGGGPVTRLQVQQEVPTVPVPPNGMATDFAAGANSTDSTSQAQLVSNEQGGRCCGVCRQPGHNRSKCPLAPGA
ncbi:hypothetical protein FA15DRAFT_661850 [Coprinopsis marcescibilis]|uniref:SWIM-type domain-containing protein n=1 Tax=Coprinopsis marcescibilis TaxID=230819 RepID=A0A5C3K9X5_COPMA|nr:hypothetical protein FA15DRAFT_661850 [Coprinopsis marcescibilis]